jgi:hypothetical protein
MRINMKYINVNYKSISVFSLGLIIGFLINEYSTGLAKEIFHFVLSSIFLMFLMRLMIWVVRTIVTVKNTSIMLLSFITIFSRTFNPTNEEFNKLIKKCDPDNDIDPIQ